MRAVYIAKFGELDDLELREVPDPPTPQKTQVLVGVRGAGLNRADLLQVRGHYPPPTGYSANIPGLEFAGEIAEIGGDVTAVSVGDRVFGITAGEAQAEYVLTDESLLTLIPETLSYAEAAAVPEAFITAHDAIVTLGELKPGESLLIHAVGSGVGLAALQIAKARGSFVFGTSRNAGKLERCVGLGLDAGIETTIGTDFASQIKQQTGERGVDVILDLVGAAYFDQNLASLALKGRLILVGLTSGRSAEFNLGMALVKRARIIGTMLRGRPLDEKAEATRGFAADVIPLICSGQIKPNLDRTFAAPDAVSAYKYLESNKSYGKVILDF